MGFYGLIRPEHLSDVAAADDRAAAKIVADILTDAVRDQLIARVEGRRDMVVVDLVADTGERTAVTFTRALWLEHAERSCVRIRSLRELRTPLGARLFAFECDADPGFRRLRIVASDVSWTVDGRDEDPFPTG